MEGAHRQFHPMKRRGTPIPVAPPRIPTPMPANNNNGPRSTSTKDEDPGKNPSVQDTQHQQRLISKAPFRLLDNDVKTAWINPRLISKVDLEQIKKSEFVSPYERNMNGHQAHHLRPSSCGRVHDREWEPPTSTTAVNGRARHGLLSSVPTATSSGTTPEPTAGVVRRVRSKPGITANLRAKTTNMPLEKSKVPKSKLPQSTVAKCARPNVARAVSNVRTSLVNVPPMSHHQVRGLTYHQQNVVCDNSTQVFGVYAETKYVYTVNGMGNNLAQASAAAAFFARAAQKLNLSSSPHRRKRYNSDDADPGGFCGALQKCPPPVPPALLRRIGVKEVTGVGKVKVMLRVSNPPQNSLQDTGGASNNFFSLDKRKKQVTLVDPNVLNGTPAPEDRRVGVAAPKMFAFDAIFSQDDSQSEVCSSALTDVIHAVINGTDGCLFCFGHAGLGKSYTMLGTSDNSNTLGIIPCAISWLFKGINEQKQKTGARFSVRVSAVEVCGPTNQLRDLLAGYSNDSEQSPGMYLREGNLFGNQPPHCELRVPSAEKAAHYLDAAIEGRIPAAKDDSRDSHLLFTLHVYQYSVAGKGGVAGGRSRLHLIDLGNSERGKASGGIPLSGVGNILLAIFNGQKHLPYKEHKLTHLLKDCLSSLTCHAAMIVHVSPFAQNYAETLTTVQLASRIHRMRRRKIKFVSTGAGSGGSSGEEQGRTTGTSSEPDPSSSDLSADTVIYVGRADDATDGEHPPVYIPSLNSGDNRCSMSKALRGSSAEQRPSKSSPKLDREGHRPIKTPCPSAKTSPAHTSSPKSSPSRIPSVKKPPEPTKHPVNGASDEQWIDGPRISKSKVAEARHLMKEPCHVKKRETWIDGPMQGTDAQGYGYMDSHKKNMIRKWVELQTFQIQKTTKHPSNHQVASSSKSVPSKEFTQFRTCSSEDVHEADAVLKPLNSGRKQEIVEEGVIRTGLKLTSNSCMTENAIPETEDMTQNHPPKTDDDIYIDDDDEEPVLPPALPIIQPLSSKEVSLESLDMILKERMLSNAEYNKSYQNSYDQDQLNQVEDDEVLEIIEVEEPLEPVPMMDSCLQVTEEDIAFCMGFSENPLPEVDQENPLDHPLRILSQENLTVVSTFTDSMSVYTDLERILPRHRYERYYDDYEDPDNPYPRTNGNLSFDDTTRRKFDQLARLHELYSNRLAKATVGSTDSYQQQQNNSSSQPRLSRCESLTLQDMLYGSQQQDIPDNSSIYSEPAYVQEKFCENCRVNMSRPNTVQNWYENSYLSASTQDLSRSAEMRTGRFHQGRNHCHAKVSAREANLAFLRHPDGASNPNLLKETASRSTLPPDAPSCTEPLLKHASNPRLASITCQPQSTPPPSSERLNRAVLSLETGLKLTQKVEEYDSGHDSTPRTSKHSPAAISRRAESGYDSVVRDSESSSVDSEPTRFSRLNRRGKCKHKHEKSFCSWFLNPFTCKYIDEPPETHF
ncbi:kinesin-like protein CG14535 isoform X2 [Euwallacea similis]|uniref:kinesin-like protein CG14535 isoform X2 n=1 Tax=Euwallacea similis TaxID=1736056 RepID=UPI00344F7805